MKTEEEQRKELIEWVSNHLQPMQMQETGAVARRADISAIRCVLFDVYGTLLISGSGDVGVLKSAVRADAFEKALKDVGLSGTDGVGEQGLALFLNAIERSHMQSRKAGVDHPEVDICEIWHQVLHALQADGALFGGDINEWIIRQFAVVYECRVNPVWLMPGAKEVLKRIQSGNCMLGIISNAQFFTPMILEALFGKKLGALGVDESLCSWSWRTGVAKPSRAIFTPVLRKLAECGVNAEQVLYVGNDVLNDIWAAQRCGCRTALFAGDQRSLRLRTEDPRCKNVQPDAVITQLDQLFGA